MLALSSEIVELREFNIANNVTEEPEFDDAGYRALVEENVKQSVLNIVNDPVMQMVCLFLVPITGTNLTPQHWDAFDLEQKGGSTPAVRRKRASYEDGPLSPVFVHGTVQSWRRFLIA